MKKGLLVAGLVLSTLAVFAQDRQNTSLGINAGFGHAWIKNYGDNKYMPAGNVGLSFIYSTKSSFGFGVDLKYSIEGSKTEGTTADVMVTNTSKLDYLRLPFKAMYFFGTPGTRVRPKISVGPSFGYLIGGEREIKMIAGGNTTANSVDAKELYDRFDIGLHAAAGINYRLVKNTWFMADLNYYNGFRNINKLGGPKFNNNNIGLNVGVNWGLGTY